jgi:hypothetical protein
MRYAVACVLFVALQAAIPGASGQEIYVAGGVGRSNWNFDCGPTGCEHHTTAFRLAAGYRFNRIVAVEAFYFDFGRARSSDPSIDGDLGGKATGAQALVGWQFADFDVAGKLGLASVRVDYRPAPASFNTAERATHTEVIGGLMAGYRVAPSLTLRLDVDIVTVALNSEGVFYSRGADVVTVLLGAAYRF